MDSSVLRIACLLIGLLLLRGGSQAHADEPLPAVESYYIAIYNVAPGKHLEFLEWVAVQEAASLEAGFPPTQWFSHVDGGSWDFIAISRSNQSPAAEARLKQIKKERGLADGIASSIEFKQFITEHSDTFAVGPFTAAGLAAAAHKRN